ncbi:hypothetical protein GIB67_030179 [Kingdonia uniflora]|uniref:Uncharacterized protein n=1 Tax=Kingdonia uniflora TaxID=39325 RepID=A0A7J7L0I8_9MAGN|nr:hypothetical protein GIB67_030179 [Kingdonia uniflora]
MFEEFHKEFCDSFNYVAVESESLETYRKFMVSRISQWGGNSNCLVKFNYRNNDIRGAISTKAYQIAMSNIEMNLRVLEKAGEEDTCITQPDIQGIQSLCSPIEVVKNNGSSKHFTSEANGNLPTTSNIAISDPPHIRPRGRPPKRIISSLADPGNKKARPEPAASVHNTAPLNSRTMGLEPNDPSHAGGTSQETQNHSGLL